MACKQVVPRLVCSATLEWGRHDTHSFFCLHGLAGGGTLRSRAVASHMDIPASGIMPILFNDFMF